MAITNPQAVAFSNEQVRPHAEVMTNCYYQCKTIMDYWNANLIGNLFPVGGGAVEDDSDASGRTPITADDVQLLMQQVQAYITLMESNGGAGKAAIIKPSVRIK